MRQNRVQNASKRGGESIAEGCAEDSTSQGGKDSAHERCNYNAKPEEKIRRDDWPLGKGEVGEKDAKAMGGLLNGLRDAILRSEKKVPIAKNLKKKADAKLKEWSEQVGSR